VNSIETGINQANKVMLGAAAVMSNGALLSRAGTAAVAMSASLAHVPVIVCAETYKFHERVQLDCITNNELGDPLALLSGVDKDHGDLLRRSIESSHEEHILNIVYDTTPAEFISVVMTEVGALPPTSVPVILREYRSETEMMVT
jgi:translation initiation factor eIF-2B subunit delta